MRLKLVTFTDELGSGWGVLSDGPRADVLDARAVARAPATVLPLLRDPNRAAWLERVAQHGARRPLSSVRIRAPIAPDSDLIAVGLNYREHVAESESATGTTRPAAPILFSKASSSIVGAGADIEIDPSITRQVDWEVELAVVIGREGRGINRDTAFDFVFAYTIANDVSARDLQFTEGGQWHRGKSLDTFCPLGPHLVMSDEIADVRNLSVELRVNGVVKQQASTAVMIFGIPEILEAVSAGRTLRAGDVILTGTPSGVGFTRKPAEFLVS